MLLEQYPFADGFNDNVRDTAKWNLLSAPNGMSVLNTRVNLNSCPLLAIITFRVAQKVVLLTEMLEEPSGTRGTISNAEENRIRRVLGELE